MKKFALIVAGGSGSRMNNSIPKQFMKINGRPVLMYTFDVFENYDPKTEFILVIPEKQKDRWNILCSEHQFNIKHKIASGGETRFQSVKNGLELIEEEGIVFIHDGVRPLASKATINNCFELAVEKGNALPVVPIPESIRVTDGNANYTVNRSNYFLVQTPQTFKTTLIKRAYQLNYSEQFTDDASVLEKSGVAINLVDGNRENIKITYPEDLLFAKTILSPQ